ncbi:MAG: glycosyltransferase family 4 protein [Candidatus Nanoarchaeia archaeon]
MRILISSIIDLEKTTYSRLHYFIEHLLNSGHEVTLVSLRDNWKHNEQRQKYELMDKINVIYLTDKRHGAIRQKLSVPFKLNKLIPENILKNMDVHLCYNSFILGYFISKKLKKFGVKTVYDLADDLPELVATNPQIPKVLRGFAGKFSKFMLERNLKHASIIMISAKEFKKSMKISRFRHEVVPNGVSVKKFTPKKVKHKGFIVGYLGALREWVDLRPMLLAVKELDKNIKILVVGGEEDLAKYKSFVKYHKMEDKVEFTGNVPYSEVPEYLNKMDVATIPFKKNSVTDGTCPLKLVEYMAMKKPCICSRLNEIKSMVGRRVMYASNKDEWKKGIQKLYNNPELRERMGKEGREFVEKHYDWEKIGVKMEKILKRNSKQQNKFKNKGSFP